jgi:rhodanese-related sulfurtransferase
MPDNKNKKKNKIIIIISLVVLALIVGALALWMWLPGESQGFVSVTPQEAIKLMQTKKDLVIIDVRGPNELSQGWIDGSVLMPLPDIMSGKIVPPKGKPILLVCAVGGRSFGLGQAMIKYGWTEIYNLKSGIADWKRQGLPLKYK